MASTLYADGSRGQAALAEINITPLVDVMLVLLVIFMVTAPIASQTLLTRLPQPNTEAAPPAESPVQLLATADGSYLLDGVAHDRSTLASALADRFAGHPERVLQIAASGDAEYQAFAGALSAAREAGVTHIAQGR